jgi:hypothetical protein
MIHRRMARIKERLVWISLHIEIAWLRFKMSKLAII